MIGSLASIALLSVFGGAWLSVVQWIEKSGIAGFMRSMVVYALFFSLPLLAVWFLYWGDEVDVLVWGMDW